MTNLARYERFDNDGIELVIDTQTGESFATISGYARMSGRAQSTISDRTHRLNDVKSAEIQTTQGIRTVRLINEDTISDWIVDDNPKLAKAMLKAGVRVFLHTSAGFKVSSAIPDHRLDPQWQALRKEGKKGRLNLTDETKAYISRHPELSAKEIKWIYAQHSDALNKGLYNRTAKELKEILSIGNKALRDYFAEDKVGAIKNIEEIAAWFIHLQDMHPVKAINEVIALTQHHARFADRHYEPTPLKATGKGTKALKS